MCHSHKIGSCDVVGYMVVSDHIVFESCAPRKKSVSSVSSLCFASNIHGFLGGPDVAARSPMSMHIWLQAKRHVCASSSLCFSFKEPDGPSSTLIKDRAQERTPCQLCWRACAFALRLHGRT
eukprot:6175593-Pleurochrysis_carterae.AAC.1